MSFFRNTWKKRENKSSDNRDITKLEISSPQELQRPQYSCPPAGNSRSLNVSVKRLPTNISSTSLVDGSWQPSESPRSSSRPSSRDQVLLQQSGRTLVHRDSGPFDIQSHSSVPTEHPEGSSRTSSLTPPKPLSPRSTKPSSSSSPPDNMSSSLSLPSIRSRKEDLASPRVLSTHTKHPPSPLCDCPPSLPPTQLLPPIDVDFKSERQQDRRAHVRPNPLCARDTIANPPKSMSHRRVSPTPSSSPKTVHAILDLSHDTKPRTLYHNTGSTPYLPYRERAQSNCTAISDNSSYSINSSEADNFPLSLFPLPPPLIVRKKVPTPLILRSTPSASAQSSCDSTPVGTPTTPRFQYTTSPSQSSITSPTKKISFGRSSTSISPPPFSPPNSPLPDPPIEGARKSTRDVFRPLRATQSNNNFRTALPFPATHRLTSSEPISDQSNLPIKRPAKPRHITERPKNIQTYMVSVVRGYFVIVSMIFCLQSLAFP